MSNDRRDTPTKSRFCRQKLMSFLKASQSKRMWKSETVIVIANKYGFVSATILRSISASFDVPWDSSPKSFCWDWIPFSNVSNMCHRAKDIGSKEIFRGRDRIDRFRGIKLSDLTVLSSTYIAGLYEKPGFTFTICKCLYTVAGISRYGYFLWSMTRRMAICYRVCQDGVWRMKRRIVPASSTK